MRSFTVEPAARIDEHKRATALISVQIMYTGRVIGGTLRAETAGSTDRADWIDLHEITALERVELVDSAVAALRRAHALTRSHA